MRQIGNPSSYQKSRSHLFVLLSGCVMTVAVWSCFAALLLVTGCTAPLPADSRSVGQPSGLEKIRHVIGIYQENWSFDGLYGKFPGADGIANAGGALGVGPKKWPTGSDHCRGVFSIAL